MRIAFASEDFVLDPISRIASPGGCTYYRCLLPANAAGPNKATGRPAWLAMFGNFRKWCIAAAADDREIVS